MVPTYAYACKECTHAFDILQSFSEDSLTVCPECGGVLRKKFNSVGVVFKGSGFYRNDSRDTSSTSSPASGSSDSSSSSTSTDKSKKTPSGASSTSDSSSSSSSKPAQSAASN
nr:FmdB family zinc ribbon protein [Arthrobacter roseus]